MYQIANNVCRSQGDGVLRGDKELDTREEGRGELEGKKEPGGG